MSKRSDFIALVAEKLEVPKYEAEKHIKGVFEAVEETIEKVGEVTIGEIGKIKRVHRAERKARNPKTGEEVHVPAKFDAKLTTSKAYKNKVNK